MHASTLLIVEWPSWRVTEHRLKWNARWCCINQETGEVFLVGDRGRAALLTEEGVKRVDTGVVQNLRCASYSPDGRILLCVGNAGLVLRGEAGRFEKIRVPVSENLRRVVWSPDGSMALIVGNAGAALLYHPRGNRLAQLEGAQNNLRAAVWPESGGEPLITGNAFAGPFIPTPNLYLVREGGLEPVAQIERVDLIGLGWSPTHGYALMGGYDVVWHEPKIYTWRGRVEELKFTGGPCYPTAIAFHPREDMAILATGHPDRSRGRVGQVFLYQGGRLKRLFEYEGLGFTSAAWDPSGTRLLLLGSRRVRTFNT